jgi:hypothetical protein
MLGNVEWGQTKQKYPIIAIKIQNFSYFLNGSKSRLLMHFCSPSFRLSKASKRSAIPASGNSEKHVALHTCGGDTTLNDICCRGKNQNPALNTVRAWSKLCKLSQVVARGEVWVYLGGFTYQNEYESSCSLLCGPRAGNYWDPKEYWHELT